MPAFSWDFLSSISGYLAAGVLLRALAILALGRALSATGTRIRFRGEVTFGLAALFLLPEAIRMLDPDLPAKGNGHVPA